MRNPIPSLWSNLIHGTSLYTPRPSRSRGAGFGVWGRPFVSTASALGSSPMGRTDPVIGSVAEVRGN